MILVSYEVLNIRSFCDYDLSLECLRVKRFKKRRPIQGTFSTSAMYANIPLPSDFWLELCGEYACTSLFIKIVRSSPWALGSLVQNTLIYQISLKYRPACKVLLVCTYIRTNWIHSVVTGHSVEHKNYLTRLSSRTVQWKLLVWCPEIMCTAY